MIEDRCSDEDHANDMIDTLKCLDTDEKIGRIRKCSDKHIKLLEIVVDSGMENIAAPACCSFYAFQECTVKTFTDICGEKALDYFKNILNEYVRFCNKKNQSNLINSFQSKKI